MSNSPRENRGRFCKTSTQVTPKNSKSFIKPHLKANCSAIYPVVLALGLSKSSLGGKGMGGGGEGFFFSTSSQVQLEAADGPGSRPNHLRYSDPHNCRDRVPSLLVSLLWKVERSLPPAL